MVDLTFDPSPDAPHEKHLPNSSIPIFGGDSILRGNCHEWKMGKTVPAGNFPAVNCPGWELSGWELSGANCLRQSCAGETVQVGIVREGEGGGR